jgi:hypothetical protein
LSCPYILNSLACAACGKDVTLRNYFGPGLEAQCPPALAGANDRFGVIHAFLPSRSVRFAQERTFGQCPRLMSTHTSGRAARSEPFRFFHLWLWLGRRAAR